MADDEAKGAAADAAHDDAGATDDDARTSRRDFLKIGGAAAAGAVVGGGIGAAVGAAIGHSAGFAEGADYFVPLTARQQAGFDHLVVLMGENRSFDNLLGYLYTADDLPDGETYEGLAFGDYSNTSPDGTVVAAHVYEGATDDIMGRPNPDPGRGVPARQHADLRHGRPRHERGALRRGHERPLQHSGPRRGCDDVRLRARLLDQLHAPAQGHPAVRRGGGADHGVVLAADAARALHAREELRRLRQLVLRGALPDVLQPLVLPCLDLARVRHQQGRRRLREVARRPGVADDLQPARGSRHLLAHLLTTSSSSSRSPGSCTRPCSSSTGAPTASRR